MAETTVFKELLSCEICNATGVELVSVLTAYGDIVGICRHGHFQGQSIDPWVGTTIELTGPLHLDSFRYYPEGWVPRLMLRLINGGRGPWE